MIGPGVQKPFEGATVTILYPARAADRTDTRDEPASDGREYLLIAMGAGLIAAVLAAGGGWVVVESGPWWAGVLSVLWGLGFALVGVRGAAVYVHERRGVEAPRPAPFRV